LKGYHKYILSGLLTLLFLYLAFRGTDVRRLVQALGETNYWWVPIMVSLILLSNLFRAWRWRFLVDPIKAQLSLEALFSAVMVGYLVNNIVPRAGELVRPVLLAKQEALSTSAVIGTVVMERVLDMASLLVIVMALPLVYDGPLRESFPWLSQTAQITAVLLCFFIVVVAVFMMRREVPARLVSMLTKLLPSKISNRLGQIVDSFLDGFLFVTRPRAFAGILLSTILLWLAYVLMHYAAIHAFHLDRTLGMRAAFVVLAISSIGVVLPTPGATGTYHFFAMQTLLRLYNVSSDTALSYATLTHAVTFFTVTILGGYYLVRDRIGIEQIFSLQRRHHP